MKRNQSGSPVSVDGLLYHFGDSLYVSSFNTEHALYILFEEIKDLNIPCYVVDSKEQTLFSTYQGMAWFTDSGFAGLHIIESTDDPLIEGENAQVGDVYLVVYDWEGNELSISYKGKRENANEFSEYREINGIYGYHSDETAPGSTVQGERRNDGFYFKDLLGNDIGAVHLNSTEGWNYVINGRMIRIVGDSYGQNYLFLAVY